MKTKPALLLGAIIAFAGLLLALTLGEAFKVNPEVSVPTESATRTFEFSSLENFAVAERIDLPLSGSAPEVNVPHIIPIEDIRRGCFRQDCIPSVDNPEFVPATELIDVLAPDSIGIALSYKGEHRFYPFPMLETHEIVNDDVAGDPILITYCPLCGTGIVFNRTLDGEAVEFGVSGMLWQSNLLMYNRAAREENRNLWSQVLGTAVVGERAGQKLEIVPSDIMRFADWQAEFPNELVLTTGRPRDPYNGEYYRVAASFAPDFDPTVAALAPDAYVYGVLVNDVPLALPRDRVPEGVTRYEHAGEALTITKTATGVVTVLDSSDNLVPDVEGFWFSWQSAYPDTIVWGNDE